VVGGRSGSEPNVQAQLDRLGGVTPPVTKRSDSPTPTSLGLRDMGTDPNQGSPVLSHNNGSGAESDHSLTDVIRRSPP
jgi:hypothetical protein